MKVTFSLLALAALAAASPEPAAKRGNLVCPAKSSYNKGGNYNNNNGAKPVVPKPSPEVNPTYVPASKPAYSPAPAPSKAAPAPVSMVCPAANKQTLTSSGSCKCSYAVNCGAKADVGASAKFWERTSGEIILSLAECVKICDDNAKCQAVIWVDDPTASSRDYHHCWQTSGLGGIISSGYGQISYKGSCSGSCSGSYLNA